MPPHTNTALEVGAARQLFVDDAAVLSRRGTIRVLHAAETQDEPVIRADRPWEGKRVYCFGSVRRDAQTGRWRMWYLSRMGEGAGSLYEGADPHGDAVLYAESDDGLTWEKPDLNVVAAGGAPSNILIPGHHAPTVFAPPDGVPGVYLAAWSWAERDYRCYHAADSIRFGATSDAPMFAPSGETLEVISVDRTPVTGQWLAYHRAWDHRFWPARRAIACRTSDDATVWSEPRRCLTPDVVDDQDPELDAAAPGMGGEFYTLSGFWYESQFLGLLPVFRVQSYDPRDPSKESDPGTGSGVVSGWDGPLDVQLASSRDGVTWQRSDPRMYVLPRGPEGRHDGGSILSTADKPVVTEDEIFVYYTAMTTSHGGPMPPKEMSIGLARWRRDGFASLYAAEEGYVETAPLSIPTGRARLMINADASGGRVTAELCGQDGRVIEGYGADACRGLDAADGLAAPIGWKGKSHLPAGQPVRIRFRLRRVHLYSYWF